MGFFSGRATFARFRVNGRAPGQFDETHLEKLAANAIGKQRVASGDGVEAGWIAAEHILDTRFDLAKNIINDTLHFALRLDQMKIPGDLLRAYTKVEMEGLAAGNPSGLPSARQKREARDRARERLEQEAADGRFLRRKSFELLWDNQSNELLVGTTSVTAIERLYTLFHHTFGNKLEPLTAGRQAFNLAETRSESRSVEDAAPSTFLPQGNNRTEVAWVPDENSRDFVGNEFLLWLWYTLDVESDTIPLADGSEVAAMFARNLVLECPRGLTGRESIRSDGPARLPEARRAIQAGKLPRQAGLTLVRHDNTYELTLHAESLAVGGAKMPVPDEEEDRNRLEERVSQLRHLLATLDLLYDAFGRRRFGSDWNKELGRLRRWLQAEGKAA